jgi:hypothetical protein
MIKTMRRRRWTRPVQCAAVLASLWLAACRSVPAPQALPAPAPPAPALVPERIDHYQIDAERSQVLVLVYRDGAMAKLGHNHVLSVHSLSGDVVVPVDISQASFRLEFPVAAMTIDEPVLRAGLGDDFSAPVDAASVDGTRAHMLGEKLLDGAHFASIRLQSGALRTEGDHWLASVRITVRDHDAFAELPVTPVVTADELSASGEFDLTHAQLGLTPYSVGLGALRVAETIHIRYHLVARRSDPGAGANQP